MFSSSIAEAEVQVNKERIHTKINPANHLNLDPKRQTVFILYDSRNALHQEFLSEVEAKQFYERTLKKYQDIDFVIVDVSNTSDAAT